jgi:outer membrane protein assembly factor BamB
MMIRIIFAVVVVFVSLPASAVDWPQWRGPQRTGISQETGLLSDWSTEGPKLLWQAKNIDDGYSTPSIVGDRIYLLSNKGMDDEFVQARSGEDGEQLWAVRIGNVGPNQGPKYPGARSTPTVIGDVLYALGSDGDLACIELKGGKIRWQKNLREDFGGKPGRWAYSESPLIDGDTLVCTPGGAEATIVALDRNSGNVIWSTALAEADEAAYASAIVVETGGVKQYVQVLQKGLVGVDAKTGNFLWRYEKIAKGSMANIPTPVPGGRFVYSASGRGGGGLVELSAAADGVEATEIYFSAKLPTSIGGAVKVGDGLYGTNRGGLMCVDFASGEVKWQERGIGAGSVCFADGRLYVHGENGDMALVEANPDEYREHGRFTPPDLPERGRSKAWAYPVVANGRLYVRDLGTLWAYDVSQAAK